MWRPICCGSCLLAALLAYPGARQAQVAPGPGYDEAWTVDLPASPTAGGAADAMRVYLPLETGALLALDRDTGAGLWTRDLPTAWPPVLSGTSLFVTAADAIHEIDAGSGRPRRSMPLPEPPSAPLVRAADRVVIPLTSGTLRSLHLDGTLAWETALGAPARTAAAIGVRGRTAFVSLDDGRLVALSLDDGGILWSQSIGGWLTAPVAARDRVVVGSIDAAAAGGLLAFDAGDGRLAWRWPLGIAIAGVVARDDLVFVASLDNVVRALDRGGGNLRWQRVMSTRPVSAPFLLEDRLFVSGVRPSMLIYDAATGEPAGTLALPDPSALSVLAGPPLVLPGASPGGVTVVVVTRDGRAIGLRPATGETGTAADDPPE